MQYWGGCGGAWIDLQYGLPIDQRTMLQLYPVAADTAMSGETRPSVVTAARFARNGGGTIGWQPHSPIDNAAMIPVFRMGHSDL